MNKGSWKLKVVREDSIENYNQNIIQDRVLDFRFSSLNSKSIAVSMAKNERIFYNCAVIERLAEFCII